MLQEQAAPKPGRGKTNADAENIKIGIALKDGKFFLGDLPIEINNEQAVAIEKMTFMTLTANILKPELADKLKAIPASGDYIRFAALRDIGLKLDFDVSQMTLTLSPTVEQRPKGSLSLTHKADDGTGDQLAKPANVSAYVNIHGGAQYGRGHNDQKGVASQAIALDGAFRVLDFVVENEAVISGGSLTRQGTRVVYDDPDNAIRTVAGDISACAYRGQGLCRSECSSY